MLCRTTLLVLAIAFLGFVATEVTADDWPQWLGPQRDGVWRETGIVGEFSTTELKVKWQQEIGGGYTGPAVADGRVFVMDYLTDGDTSPSPSRRNKLQGTERVLCFSVDDGQLLWKHEYDRPYNISFPAGPRVTPTVDGDRVYTLGSEGNLICLRTKDGSVIWSRDLPKDYEMDETPIWGFSGHPLVDGDKLICLVGGEGSVAVAFNKFDGKEIWKSLSAAQPGYCPPTMIKAGGTRQLLIWHSQSLNSLNPDTGEVYWSEALQPSYEMAIATPRMDGNFLFVGAIVNISMLLKLDANRPAAELIWKGAKDRGIGPVFSTPFLEHGYMYGVDRKGELRCVELESGKHVWSSNEATHADRRDSPNMFLIKHEDRFFLANDLGELIIAKLSPDGYQEISRAQMIDPQTMTNQRKVVWSHPAFANRCVFARNDQRIVCISLADTERPGAATKTGSRSSTIGSLPVGR